MKVSKLKIRNKPGCEGQISKGANVELLLDDKPLNGCYAVEFTLVARDLAKVRLELFAEIDAEVFAEIKKKPIKIGRLKRHRLGKLSPL